MKATLAAQIDRKISDVLENGFWRKTAFVLASVTHDLEDRQIMTAPEEVFERVLSLCASGLLESQGVLTQWRHSELRLKLSHDSEVN